MSEGLVKAKGPVGGGVSYDTAELWLRRVGWPLTLQPSNCYQLINYTWAAQLLGRGWGDKEHFQTVKNRCINAENGLLSVTQSTKSTEITAVASLKPHASQKIAQTWCDSAAKAAAMCKSVDLNTKMIHNEKSKRLCWPNIYSRSKISAASSLFWLKKTPLHCVYVTLFAF